MVQINFAKREVQCKVVYYGPARSGKTTNLRSIHERAPERVRGQLTTIATDTNRTRCHHTGIKYHSMIDMPVHIRNQ